MSNITLTAYAHAIRYYAPTTTQIIIFAIVMLFLVMGTIKVCKWEHRHWMHLHGDRVLGDRIVGLQYELDEAKSNVARLEASNAALRAQIKAAIQQSGKVANQQSQLLSILTLAREEQ